MIYRVYLAMSGISIFKNYIRIIFQFIHSSSFETNVILFFCFFLANCANSRIFRSMILYRTLGSFRILFYLHCILYVYSLCYLTVSLQIIQNFELSMPPGVTEVKSICRAFTGPLGTVVLQLKDRKESNML